MHDWTPPGDVVPRFEAVKTARYTKRHLNFKDGRIEFFALSTLTDVDAFGLLLGYYGGQDGKTET
jgi:hypothetical protein